MKLFKTCSWHFNTHFHFECDHILQRKAILKLTCFFWGLHEKSLRSLLMWNEITISCRHVVVFSFLCHCFFLPAKAKCLLIAIANIHWCDCEYKWDCWAPCSHGNTSRMWCADWPWAAEFPFAHEFNNEVRLWVSAWQWLFWVWQQLVRCCCCCYLC